MISPLGFGKTGRPGVLQNLEYNDQVIRGESSQIR